jgi:hypothetical protein
MTSNNDPNSASTLEFTNGMSTGALQSNHHSKSGPAIAPVDPATEREQLITANQAFARALKQALRSGAETTEGVLATARPKRRKNGILAL